MSKIKLMGSFFIFFVLVLGFSSTVFAYNSDVCPERFFDAERGCQIPVVMEFAPAADVHAAADTTICPSSFYDTEKGCQIRTAHEYVEEYALVEEVAEEEIYRGCPASLFDSEKGCQVPVISEYNP